jgi:hypothetical protein
MPGTGSYISGSASADYKNSVDELLSQLPDNSANLIVAQNIRDSVWTLWNRIDDVEVTSLQAASFSALYKNTNPVPITIGGIQSGTTFTQEQTMKQMWDALLYPYLEPSLLLSINTNVLNREYGSSNQFVLNWNVVKKTNSIISIIVDGQSFPNNITSGTKTAIGTYSNVPPTQTINTFSMIVNDGETTVSKSVSITWMNKRYWGKVDLSSLGDINLTINPSPSIIALINNTINSNTINNLSGANANEQPFGSELVLGRSKVYSNINGSGNHLIFAFPSAYSSPTSQPTFTVNGTLNTAFTKVKENFALVNSFGFSGTNYDVWISNTPQNAPLNVEII